MTNSLLPDTSFQPKKGKNPDGLRKNNCGTLFRSRGGNDSVINVEKQLCGDGSGGKHDSTV